jgi:hypothetical protein
VPIFRRLGCLAGFTIIILILLIVFAAMAPWALHIGGRWTPMSWWGYGTLRTDAANYPIFIYFYPNPRNASHLRLNGVRPSNGLDGNGWLCSAPGETQYLSLSGTIYGAYLTTDAKQMQIRLLDWALFPNNAPHRRYFDLLGQWNGPELTMRGEEGSWAHGFGAGSPAPKDAVNITFTSGSYADFKKLCAAAAIPQKARIAPAPK